MKTTYRKTCAGNLLMWSDLTLGPLFKVKRQCPNLKVPLSHLLLVLLLVKRGWPSLKVPISSLLLLPEVWDVKLTLNSTFLLPGGRLYHCSGLVCFTSHSTATVIIVIRSLWVEAHISLYIKLINISNPADSKTYQTKMTDEWLFVHIKCVFSSACS